MKTPQSEWDNFLNHPKLIGATITEDDCQRSLHFSGLIGGYSIEDNNLRLEVHNLLVTPFGGGDPVSQPDMTYGANMEYSSLERHAKDTFIISIPYYGSFTIKLP